MKKILKIREEVFVSDFAKQLQGERIFEVIAQIILDICTYIVANSEMETPSSYAECIKALETLGIFDKESTTRFVSLIKMRNLIAH